MIGRSFVSPKRKFWANNPAIKLYLGAIFDADASHVPGYLWHFRLTAAQVLPIWTIFNTATFTHRGKARQGQTTSSGGLSAVEYLN